MYGRQAEEIIRPRMCDIENDRRQIIFTLLKFDSLLYFQAYVISVINLNKNTLTYWTTRSAITKLYTTK